MGGQRQEKAPGTTSELLGYRNLVDALEAAPGERPFVTVWIDEDERDAVTFGEFRDLARRRAFALKSAGASASDRVVIIMPQSIAAMTTFVGAMMIGAVPAFLAYPNFKVEPGKYRSGLAGVTTNIRAKAVIIDEEFPEEMLACVRLDGATRLIRAGRIPAAVTTSVPSVIKPSADDLAFLQHSAGTTGLQKGVALTHGAVLWQLRHLAEAIRVDGATDRIYSWLPLYHDMGLIACFILPMVCHLSVVMQSPIEWVMQPEAMLQIIRDEQCTLAWMPNFAFQFVPRRTPESRWKDYDLSCLRLLINCSEPVRASSMEQFQSAFGLRPGVLQSCYAMAENVFAVTQSSIDSAGPATIHVDGLRFRREGRVIPAAGSQNAMTFMSSGRLLPDHCLRIQSEQGNVLGEDSVGEIVIQSDCLFEGYYNRPDLTAQVLSSHVSQTRRDPSTTLRASMGHPHQVWYRTGDLGFVHGGELYVVGRKKDLLIVGGENIYPQDIEELVAGHPAIHDGRVVALGVESPELGTEEIVVVAEVQDEGLLCEQARLEQELRALVVSGMGVAVRTFYLKPPKWIVKSTAGKAARSATREKLFLEHPELNGAARV